MVKLSRITLFFLLSLFLILSCQFAYSDDQISIEQMFGISHDDPLINSSVEKDVFKTKESIYYEDCSKGKDKCSWKKVKDKDLNGDDYYVTFDKSTIKKVKIGDASDLYELVNVIVYNYSNNLVYASAFDMYNYPVFGEYWVNESTNKFGFTDSNNTDGSIRSYSIVYESDLDISRNVDAAYKTHDGKLILINNDDICSKSFANCSYTYDYENGTITLNYYSNETSDPVFTVIDEYSNENKIRMKVTDPNLIGYWSADAESYIPGKHDTQMSFDGVNDYILSSDTEGIFYNGGEATISFLFESDCSGNGRILTQGGDAAYPIFEVYCSPTLGFIFTRFRSDSITYDSTDLAVINGDLRNKSSYVTLIYNSTHIKGYIDGVLNNTVSYDYNAGNYTWTKSAIGALRRAAPSNYFNGLIDDIKFINRTLNADEVKALYSNVTLNYADYTPDPDLFIDYDFNLSLNNKVNGEPAPIQDGFVEYVWNNVDNSTGTVYGKTYIGEGHIGEGYQYDGLTTSIDTGLNYNTTNPFTFSAWVKRSDEDRNTAILNKGANTQFNFHIHNTILLRSGGVNSYSNNAVLVSDGWTHVAVTYNGSEIAFYINGIQNGTATRTLSDTDDEFTIGSYISSFNFYNGSIDEIRIYNKSLSQTDMFNLYSNQLPTYENPTYAYGQAYNVLNHTINRVNITTPWFQNYGNGRVEQTVGTWDNSTYVGEYDDDDLLGYWHLDSDYLDYSGNGFNGTGAGNLINTTGKWAGAFYFDGYNDYITLPKVDALQPKLNFSISMWINLTNISATQYIYDNAYNGVSKQGFLIYTTGTNLYFRLGNGTYINAAYYTLDGITHQNKWIHVFTTYDGTSATIYVNNNQGTTLPIIGGVNYSSGNIYLSRTFASATNGSIDEVMLINRTLTSEERISLYRSGVTEIFNGVGINWSTNRFKNMSEIGNVEEYEISDSPYYVEIYNLTSGEGQFNTPLLYNDSTSFAWQGPVCIPNIVNTSWTSWSDFGSCLINDSQYQNRSLLEYDSNGCSIYNATYWDYQYVECNYCSYSVTNTSWTDYINLTCLPTDYYNESRNLTEYDANYDTCYAVTGLPSDLWNMGANITYIEYRTGVTTCDGGTAPVFTNLQNYTLYSNESNFRQTITAADVNGVSCYTINATNYEINCTGDIINSTPLSVSMTYINITVNDTYNNIREDLFWINVIGPPFSFVVEKIGWEWVKINWT